MKVTLILLVVMISSCLAANWYVSPIGNDSNSGTSSSSPFRTINKAYTVSKSGDTILLMPGLYTGSSNLITFQSSRNLTSQDPSAKAVINGQGSCLSVYAGYSTSISVSFSQIQFNGCSDGITISTYSGSSAYVDIANVEFSGVSNRAIYYSPSSGGLTVSGIAFDKCSTALSLGASSNSIPGVVTISDCSFTGSTATDKAILSYNAANSIRINNSVFRSYGGAAVDISFINDVNFNNCSFLNNLNTALKLTNIGTGLLQDSTFQNNNGTNGGAINLSGTSSTLLGANNSYFFNNIATNGGAAYVYGATFNVQYSTITSNSAAKGGDYYCAAGGHVYEYSCKSSGNTGADGGCSL